MFQSILKSQDIKVNKKTTMKLLNYKQIGLIICLFIFSNNLRSEIIQESGSLFNKVSNFISNIPGNTGDHYKQPLDPDINTWNNIITDLINSNYTSASINANTLAYDIIEFTDTDTTLNKVYYILSPNSSNHWGFYIFNPNYCRSLVIQAPHPLFDFNTGKQGIHVFKETNALFFCLSGTHRCNSSDFSSCSGTTSVCNDTKQKFKISDLAHNDNSIFQETTKVLFNNFNDSYFIQLHGFEHGKDDPYLILSNGTQVTPTDDYLVDFKEALLSEDNTLTAVVAHIDLEWDSLRGFSNTQGRLINKSADICNLNATLTDGRFFHVEQEKLKLRNDISGWNKVSTALKNIFSCQASLTIKDDYLQDNILTIYPNPTSDTFTIKGFNITLKEIEFFSLLGHKLNNKVNIYRLDNTKILVDMSKLSDGFYIVKSKKTRHKILKK